jgi:hypothetical protein
MVQELMDLLMPNFDDSDGVTDGAPCDSVVNDQLFVAMSKDALAGSDGPKMMLFMGSI